MYIIPTEESANVCEGKHNNTDTAVGVEWGAV